MNVGNEKRKYKDCPKYGQKSDMGEIELPKEQPRIIFGKIGCGMSFSQKFKALGRRMP